MRILLLAIGLLLADMAAAQHDARVRLIGSPQTINISGRPGDNETILSSNEPHAFLTGIAVRERRDSPCHIMASFRSVPNGRATMSTDLDSHTGCNGNGEGTRGSNQGVYARETASGGFGAIHGVRLGSNDRNNNNYKLKGLRGMVTVINRDDQGRLRRDGGLTRGFERTNFRKWEQRRVCPTGQIAVGVVVYYRDEYRDSVTGLGLQCQRATVTPI